MRLDLNNKRVIITGGSKGLGLHLAVAFARSGAKVAVLARNVSKLQESLRENQFEGLAQGFTVDVSDEKQVAGAIAAATTWLGGLDVLVNNAGGVEKYLGITDLADQDWIDAFRLNVLGIVHTVKYSLPFLKKSSAARVINIGSVTALQPGQFNPHYSVAKAGALNLTKHLANVLAKEKILVNGIIPGTFQSDAWDRNIDRVAREKNQTHAEARETETNIALSTIPLGRIGTPDDIAPFVLMLASELSAWTTGSCFVVDGGKYRGIH